MPSFTLKEKQHNTYGRCITLSNGGIEVLVTVDVGPRIIYFGFVGGHNEFCEEAPITVPVGNTNWRLMGGHRFWHSPEAYPRTYSPDNEPVEWCQIEGGVKVSQKVERWVQIKKEMEITLAEDSSKAKILHRLINKNAWPVELAAWALTVMAPGGIEIMPQTKRDTGLLPNRILVLWPYSKMNDPRVCWGEKFILLRQDPSVKQPFKLGISDEEGWAAYLNHGNLFIKRFTYRPFARYPDFGVSYETYTNNYILEMETLSPLTLLEPEASVEHVEEWELIGGVEVTEEVIFDEKYERELEELLASRIIASPRL